MRKCRMTRIVWLLLIKRRVASIYFTRFVRLTLMNTALTCSRFHDTKSGKQKIGKKQGPEESDDTSL